MGGEYGTSKNNVQVHLWYHCCCGKAISITYSEYESVALVICYAKYMAWFFGGGELLNIKCVFSSSLELLSETETFFILRRI